MNKIQKIVVAFYCASLIATLIWFPIRWESAYSKVLDYGKEALQILVLTLIASALTFAFKTKKN